MSSGKHWLHEVKHGGFRVIGRKVNALARCQQ
jgi:hypothetical protein